MSLGRRAHPPRAVLFVYSFCSPGPLPSLWREWTPGGDERFFTADACHNPPGPVRVERCSPLTGAASAVDPGEAVLCD